MNPVSWAASRISHCRRISTPARLVACSIMFVRKAVSVAVIWNFSPGLYHRLRCNRNLFAGIACVLLRLWSSPTRMEFQRAFICRTCHTIRH
jgi:hypothetical protein